MLYMQTVDGNRAHCTFQMLRSLRTKRGVPPRMGMAKIEEGVSGLADSGVEIYKISEPSGVTLGCEGRSAAVPRFSAKGSSVASLTIPPLPFRPQLTRPTLLPASP